MSTTTVAPPLPGRATSSLAAALVQRLRALSYYSTADFGDRRDLRVDLLRGFCIFAMVVDHFGGDSWLYAITGGNRFYVSAAEGFIFISGFIMGQAYRAKRDRAGLQGAMGDALRRARTLYLATVAMTLIFSALFLYTDITLWTSRDFGLGIDSWQEIVVAALTLHYTYHGTDILAMYTILLMVAPLILLMLSIGDWWMVLIPSWLLWLAYQVYPEEAAVPWYIRHGENFPIAAWQVLFVTGHVLGFYRGALTAWLEHFRRLRVFGVALGVAVTLGLISLAWGAEYGFFDIDPNVLDESFFKVPLRPARIIAFLSVAIVAYTCATYLWVPMRRALGWLMLPLGQAALYCYIVHFFLIVLVYNLAPMLALLPGEPPEQVLTTLLQVAVVLLLWGLVRKRVLFGVVPN
ncbi:MAG: OpgC domain-containing protein [Chloroflexi bacterium]|nr:OpgC domain-containing protein [Chloroflexota bacterium]MBV9598539.1 OpgC domain-containing protein [Chloroflexota bacterium]